MFETLDELLDEELRSQIKDISTMTTGSEEKSKAIDDFVKLSRLLNEDVRSEKEISDAETQRKEIQKEQKTERYVRIGIAAAELIVPLIFYGLWMRKGLKFEETGSFTSTTFRGLINRFRPEK